MKNYLPDNQSQEIFLKKSFKKVLRVNKIVVLLHPQITERSG